MMQRGWKRTQERRAMIRTPFVISGTAPAA
jgi:hypothetical protein